MNRHRQRLSFFTHLAIWQTFLLGGVVHADVRLPGFFNDHMVVQADAEIVIWGWADASEQVTVSLGEHSATTEANDDKRWQVRLPAMPASHTPWKLTVRGTNTIEIDDLLVGEVWLCSGQSNMEWSVAASADSKNEIAAADYPLIRHVKIPRRPSNVPLDDVEASWQVCSPETAGGFTAVGFFMARHLSKELDVPVGLINASWGGTRIEPWTPPNGFQQVDALESIYQSVVGRTPGTESYNAVLEKHLNQMQKWMVDAQAKLATQEIVPPNPVFPASLVQPTSHQEPVMLFNGMIHPLVGYPIRGAIWYQGESNHGEGMLYTEKKKALVAGWRELWQQGDFPFYYVQIAPFQYGEENPEVLAEFWEAQAAAQTIPNTAMVVINDIATLGDIHPSNKQDVGYRLALLALRNDYGRQDVVARSPELESLEIADDHLKITFRYTGGGLTTRDGASPTHFELLGPDSDGFQSAEAVIQGDTVTLRCDAVRSPTAFRFAWHKLAQPNLTGGTGLPVAAVRGGELPNQ